MEFNEAESLDVAKLSLEYHHIYVGGGAHTCRGHSDFGSIC